MNLYYNIVFIIDIDVLPLTMKLLLDYYWGGIMVMVIILRSVVVKKEKYRRGERPHDGASLISLIKLKGKVEGWILQYIQKKNNMRFGKGFYMKYTYNTNKKAVGIQREVGVFNNTEHLAYCNYPIKCQNNPNMR
jgi:hypothetical protein